MVTSGPLLPIWGDEWQEYRYVCAACRLAGKLSDQYVTFKIGEVVPASLRLPCFGAALDAKNGLEHVPMHLYLLAEAVGAAGDEQDGGGQARPEGAEGEA